MLSSISPDTDVLVSSLTALLEGGKRLRPAFAYWGYRSTGAPDSDAVVRACSSLEFLQACALIHDDVMDNSDTRRGMPAVHKQFEHIHSSSGWSGEAQSFGVGAAILVGDLALSWADDLLLRSGVSDEQIVRAKDVYDTMRTELMAGQYLDLLEQARRNTTVESARNVIRYKSAKYTIERPLHMGAAIAHADEAHMNALSVYGLELGEAFQLRDDILGVFGDSATTGKPAGDDLREKKQTVLLAHALNNSTYCDQILHILDKDVLSNDDVLNLQNLMTQSGATDIVELSIEEHKTNALTALEHPTIDPLARQALTELAIMATQRKA